MLLVMHHYTETKTVAVIGYSPKEESEAEFLAEVCEKVLYIPMYKEENKII